MAYPEDVVTFQVNDITGLFDSITLRGVEDVDGDDAEVERDYDTKGWRVRVGHRVIRSGEHAFGQCQVLAFTENRSTFPHIGKFEQIATMSRDLFNLRSELREILRSQTFSLLTLQIPVNEVGAVESAAKLAATIGTHSMLAHQGIQPAFIAPDSGPAQTYLDNIGELKASIRAISLDDSTSDATSAAESGTARRLRFEALNAELASFAASLAQLELRVWAMFHRAFDQVSSVTVTPTTDFNLVDTLAELDVLTSMQSTGFPLAVQAAKKRAVVLTEFDSSSDDEKAALLAAIDEQAQEAPPAVKP
jgi:hypothetical protein